MAGAAAIAMCTEGPELDLLSGPGTAHALVHPGVGATLRAMHRIVLEDGSETDYDMLRRLGAVFETGD
jgi:hypothetical protein